jgi:hypothetical protein
LVYGDYEAVMPLPWRKKYGIKYIYTPVWVQQLGVFMSDQMSSEVQNNFVRSIPAFFQKISYPFHEGHIFEADIFIKRDNYVLDLNVPYTQLIKNYRKNRRRILQKSEYANIQIVENENSQYFLQLFKTYIQPITRHTDLDVQKLENILNTAQQKFQYNLYEAYEGDKILGSAIFLIGLNRSYYLASALNSKGKESQAMSFIINNHIKKNAEKSWILDFEGSIVPGIASFFRSFGTRKTHYYLYEKKFSIYNFFQYLWNKK